MKRNHNAEASHTVGTLAEDAKALLAATAEVAEDKVVAARERLSDALEHGREAWGTVQDGAVQGVKATDKTIRLHPYQAIGLAFGVGALMGCLLMRRSN